jgi:Phage protein.
MFTLEINGKELNLSFGMGFVRDINETVKQPLTARRGSLLNAALRLLLALLLTAILKHLQTFSIPRQDTRAGKSSATRSTQF